MTSARQEAAARARKHSPFLRESLDAHSDIERCFLGKGAGAAIDLALSSNADSTEVKLRKQRARLALAVALGDLAGELLLEDVTRSLSDFADGAIDAAVAAAIAERVPGAGTEGFAMPRNSRVRSMATTSLGSSTTQMTSSERRGSLQIRHCSPSATL